MRATSWLAGLGRSWSLVLLTLLVSAAAVWHSGVTWPALVVLFLLAVSLVVSANGAHAEEVAVVRIEWRQEMWERSKSDSSLRDGWLYREERSGGA